MSSRKRMKMLSLETSVIDAVSNENSSLVEAIADYAEQHNIPIEEIKKYLSPSLKQSLKEECIKLNLLKKDVSGDDLNTGNIMHRVIFQ